MKNKFGFTLAEILITLGIIGIVAALTIPNLIAKYKLKVLETNFKYAYSLLLNANALMKEDYPLSFEPNAKFDYQDHLRNLAKYIPNSTFCPKKGLCRYPLCGASRKYMFNTSITKYLSYRSIQNLLGMFTIKNRVKTA